MTELQLERLPREEHLVLEADHKDTEHVSEQLAEAVRTHDYTGFEEVQMSWGELLFHDWEGIMRTVVVGTLAYIVLILFLRISGKRTLAKLNAFDLVVTVALGSTLATVLLQKSVPLAEGAVALALLIFLQFLVAFVSVRHPQFAKLVRSEPTLLARHGAFCQTSMTHSRITEDEALSAVRSSGGRGLADVETLILESDGTISVSLKFSP